MRLGTGKRRAVSCFGNDPATEAARIATPPRVHVSSVEDNIVDHRTGRFARRMMNVRY